jgi:hypothetical protein
VGFRNRAFFHLKNVRDRGLRAEMFGALAAYALYEPLAARQEGLADAVSAASGPPAAGGRDDRAILEPFRRP